jgi:2-oxoglutarate dehydrogenase E2 component (dihydrolipoamide succinyltransferase)
MAEIKVPTLGESVSEATVSQWLKKEGDQISADEPLVELETDKVTLEVNAPEGGILVKISVSEGDTVEVGALLGEISASGSANENKAAAKKEKEESVPSESNSNDEGRSADLSPAVRKLIDDNDLDPEAIKGTGKDGRLTKGDVLDYLESDHKSEAPAGKAPESQPPANKPALEKPHAPRALKEREERVKMTRLRQSIAKRLKEAQNTAAMLTTFNEIDMTAAMDLRKAYKDQFEKKHGVKLGFMSFFVKAVTEALKEFPAINAEIDGDDIIYKNYYDIGVAVSTEQGLVVPVLRDADQMTFAEVEGKIGEYAGKARQGKISMDEMTGGTFTVTNGGVFGSLMSTPILNPPQVGILGMHKIEKRPIVMPDGSIQARPMMYVALSYDHRIVDGRESVSFLVKIKEALEDPQRLLLNV